VTKNERNRENEITHQHLVIRRDADGRVLFCNLCYEEDGRFGFTPDRYLAIKMTLERAVMVAAWSGSEYVHKERVE